MEGQTSYCLPEKVTATIWRSTGRPKSRQRRIQTRNGSEAGTATQVVFASGTVVGPTTMRRRPSTLCGRSTTGKIAEAVAIGIVVGWFIIWLGAELVPDHIYWPVKFVVKELPEGLR
jgi:hypothetical protein